MRREADPSSVVVDEDVVQKLFTSRALVLGCLAFVAAPELVRLCEVCLEAEVGDEGLDVCLAGAAVACVDADAFA